MKYKLYILNHQNQLQSYDNDKHNIYGWYDELQIATADLQRASSLEDRQIVLASTGDIIRIAKKGKYLF